MKLYTAYVRRRPPDLVEIQPVDPHAPRSKVHALDAQGGRSTRTATVFPHPEWDELARARKKTDAPRSFEAAEKGLQYVGLEGTWA